MSRVMSDQKWVNTPRRAPAETNPSPVTRLHTENENYCAARTLTDWLFLKYDMSYKSYRRKKPEKRLALRLEYEKDTGEHLLSVGTKDAYEYDLNCVAEDILRECGVPFGPCGEPLGI